MNIICFIIIKFLRHKSKLMAVLPFHPKISEFNGVSLLCIISVYVKAFLILKILLSALIAFPNCVRGLLTRECYVCTKVKDGNKNSISFINYSCCSTINYVQLFSKIIETNFKMQHQIRKLSQMKLYF